MARKILAILFVLYNCTCFAQQGAKEIDYTLMGSPLPFFRMVILDTAMKEGATETTTHKRRHDDGDEDRTIVKGKITAKEITNSGNLFVMMFSPTCEHCEAMTQLWEKNIGSFKNAKLVLMTNPKFREYMPGFMKKLNTLQFPQMHVGLDDSDFIKETFLYQPLPQINVYNSERKLIKTFTGEIPFDSLKQYVN